MKWRNMIFASAFLALVVAGATSTMRGTMCNRSHFAAATTAIRTRVACRSHDWQWPLGLARGATLAIDSYYPMGVPAGSAISNFEARGFLGRSYEGARGHVSLMTRLDLGIEFFEIAHEAAGYRVVSSGSGP